MEFRRKNACWGSQPLEAGVKFPMVNQGSKDVGLIRYYSWYVDYVFTF